MNETDSSRDLSTDPKDSREVRTEFKTGGTRCTARSTRTGEPCKRPAMLGGNVCRSHGGAAPQVKAKAQRRLQQAADALVQRLLGMALDGDTPDHVALQAIRDALDRAGLGAKQSVELSAKRPEPWEEMMMDFARTSRERQSALERGKPEPTGPARKADEPMEVVDAEVVDDGPETQPERDGEGANDAGAPPPFAEPSHPPSRELATLEDATADAAAGNRRARVVRVRRRR
jgi:hypothetical protein